MTQRIDTLSGLVTAWLVEVSPHVDTPEFSGARTTWALQHGMSVALTVGTAIERMDSNEFSAAITTVSDLITSVPDDLPGAVELRTIIALVAVRVLDLAAQVFVGDPSPDCGDPQCQAHEDARQREADERGELHRTRFAGYSMSDAAQGDMAHSAGGVRMGMYL